MKSVLISAFVACFLICGGGLIEERFVGLKG